MTRKELEHKIIKALHKANRAKTLKLKLEKVNEVRDEIQRLLAGVSTDARDAETRAQAETSSKRLEQYLELCRIHKLKFQLDALLYGVAHEYKALAKEPEQMTQERFDSFVRRLNVVLDTDPEHPEALGLLEQLNGNYLQHAEGSCVRNVYIDLSEYQEDELSVAFECPLKSIAQTDKLSAEYSKYQKDSDSIDTDGSKSVRLQFSSKQLGAFAVFHEELHTSAEYKIFVNGKRMEEALFSEWFHCYRRYLKAESAQYCYGASPFTLNVFGCHKLSLPDIAAQLDQCWFNHGMLDQQSGLFLLASEQIAENIRRHLDACGFCPFLSQEKLHLGMGLLPQYINPECDEHWEYLYEDGLRIGVVPSGSEIAIARQPLENDKLDPAGLIEVDSSAYARRMLEFVETQDKRVLSETRYKGITRCLNCGTHYKAHSMDCPRCKSDFVRDALADPDKVLRELNYIQPVKYPSPLQKNDTSQAPAPASQKAVSFDQLWNDPQVRKMLSNDSAEQESAQESANAPEKVEHVDALLEDRREAPAQKTEDASEAQTLPAPADEIPAPSARRPASSDRFDLHGKLRSLMSKKYRERKALEDAFSEPEDFALSPPPEAKISLGQSLRKSLRVKDIPSAPVLSEERIPEPGGAENDAYEEAGQEMDEDLLNAIKRLKPRQRSELSKRGVVRVIYHATMDKDECPLCAYLDGMVMDPDDPGTDIFSPPLYPGCTCSREYVLKTEKPSNWPELSFKFPPKELLSYLKR